MDQQPANVWRKCSSCKNSILLGARYYVCSVSTCNGQRTGYVFCSVHCFERHLPAARHKDAGAVEKIAPKTPDPIAATPPPSAAPAPARVYATNSSTSQAATGAKTLNAAPKEVLVIASRLKDYVTARSEFNTSASVMEALSDHLRIVCDRAIENARADGRKTVMDRDFEFLKGRG